MRTIRYGVANVAVNSSGRASLGRPKPGQRWDVRRIAVKATNWLSGDVYARVLVDGAERAASRQGNADVAQGETITVYASQHLEIEWVVTANVKFSVVDTVLRCRAEVELVQSPG